MKPAAASVAPAVLLACVALGDPPQNSCCDKCRDSVLSALRTAPTEDRPAPKVWRVAEVDGEGQRILPGQTVGWHRPDRRVQVAESRGDVLIVSEWDGRRWVSGSSGDRGAIVLEAFLPRIPLLDVAAFVDNVPIPSQVGSAPLEATLGRHPWAMCENGGGVVAFACPLFENRVKWLYARGPASCQFALPFEEVAIRLYEAPQTWPVSSEAAVVMTYEFRSFDETGHVGGTQRLERVTTAVGPDGTRRSQRHEYSRVEADERWASAIHRLRSPEPGTELIDAALGLRTAIGSSEILIGGASYHVGASIESPWDVDAAVRRIATGKAAPRTPMVAPPPVAESVRAVTQQEGTVVGDLDTEAVSIVLEPVQFVGTTASSRCTLVLRNRGGVPRRIARCVPTCGCLSSRSRADEVLPGADTAIEISVRLSEPGLRRERLTLVFDDGATQVVQIEASAVAETLLFASPRCFEATEREGRSVLLLLVAGPGDVPPPPRWISEPEDAEAPDVPSFSGWERLRPSASPTAVDAHDVWRGELTLDASSFRGKPRRTLRVGTSTVQLRGDGVPWR